MPSFLFSEKKRSWKFPLSFFFFFFLREIMCHLLPFLTSYSMFWVQDCLGRASALWQIYLRTVPSVIPADPICPSGYMRGFWKHSAIASLKVYLAKEQTPRKNVYKANVCILFGDLPGCSSLKHQNKLSCQGKNIMHNSVLTFHAVYHKHFWLEITKELLLDETVHFAELVFFTVSA